MIRANRRSFTASIPLLGIWTLASSTLKQTALAGALFHFTLENPAYVASFITAHILNTEIGGMLALPLIEKFESLSAPVNLYWVAWDGTLAWYNLVLLLIYLAIIAVGFGAAWRRIGWIGLLPLAVNLGYTLANGISRFSSWRYNLPVDWVIYFYFAIGAMEILGGLTLLFGAKTEKIFPAYIPPATRPITLRDFRPQYVFIILAFMAIGALPWFAEGLAQPRFTATQEQLVTKLESSGYTGEEVRAFLSQPGAVLMEGRMLYPRLYRRNEGISSTHPWPEYEVKGFFPHWLYFAQRPAQRLDLPNERFVGFSARRRCSCSRLQKR